MQSQKLLSLTPPLMWLNEIIDTVDGQGTTGDYYWHEGLPYLSAGPNKECKWPPRILRREMLEAFRSRCMKARPHGASEFTGSPERFWREIHKVIPKSQTNHQTSNGQRVVSIDLVDLKANLEKYLRGDPV
jgi:hypothetical protein